MALTGAESGLFNVYSMTGLIVVVAVTSFPYVFVFTSAALDLVSSEMEDAANILGAGTLRTTFRVTLPLVLPAIVGGLIISFLEAIALFGAPALIALPARFQVVSTQLWQFFEYPVRVEQAAAYAMPLLLITHLHVLAAAQRARPARLHHGQRQGRRAAHHPARAVALGDARLCAVRLRARGVPADDRAHAGGVRASAWGRGFSLENLTLQNFHYILFEQTQAQNAIINTFVYSGITAFAAIGCRSPSPMW